MKIEVYKSKSLIICRMAVWEWNDPLIRHMASKKMVKEAREAQLRTPFVIRMVVPGVKPVEYRVGADEPNKNIDDEIGRRKGIEVLDA